MYHVSGRTSSETLSVRHVQFPMKRDPTRILCPRVTQKQHHHQTNGGAHRPPNVSFITLQVHHHRDNGRRHPPPTPPPHHHPPSEAQHHPKFPDPKHGGGGDIHHDHSDQDDRCDHRRHAIAKGVAILLLLLGLTALIIWLVYRPENPQFAVSAASIYGLNDTSTTPPLFSASFQFTILLRNPNKRVSIHYDRLSAHVTYRNQPITPVAPLPLLHQRTRSLVSATPVLGAEAVPVPAEVASGLAADEAFGVLGLRVVVAGTMRWKAGAVKTSRKRMTAACEVVVGYRGGVPGQVPLLSARRCKVDV